jgi:hypothetical protein
MAQMQLHSLTLVNSKVSVNRLQLHLGDVLFEFPHVETVFAGFEISKGDFVLRYDPLLFGATNPPNVVVNFLHSVHHVISKVEMGRAVYMPSGAAR